MFQSPLNFKALRNQDLLLPRSQIGGLNSGGLAADVTLHRCEHLFLPVCLLTKVREVGWKRFRAAGGEDREAASVENDIFSAWQKQRALRKKWWHVATVHWGWKTEASTTDSWGEKQLTEVSAEGPPDLKNTYAFHPIATKGNEPFTRLLRVRALLGFPEVSVSGVMIFDRTQQGKF